MWGRPRGSSAFLTSADVISFQPSNPRSGGKEENLSEHPTSRPTPYSATAHCSLKSWKFGHPVAKSGQKPGATWDH